MTFYDFLSTFKSNCKVVFSYSGETYDIFAKSVELLRDEVKEAVVKEWAIEGNLKLTVTLEESIPSA
jgi:hypothetical protein